jgi:phosphoglycerate dehydrogenase-like enzyme
VLARAEARLAWRPPARLAARAPRLRWIQSFTGGCDQWLASPDLPPDAMLTCARGTHRQSMPENVQAAALEMRVIGTRRSGAAGGPPPLALMKPSARLLNFARGDLVVDADLVEAVRARRIAGAVLDVFTREPLPPDSPLWTTDGIVVFPHVGGLRPRRDDFVAALWVDNLRRFAAGQPLREAVDRARGY